MKLGLGTVSRILALFLALAGTVPAALAQTNKRIVLQGFWWNFKNNNYPMGWANYLIDMAPRLRALGIQAVWVPPHVKNANPGSVGYVPFDHYDLGDKFQKGNLKTPLGDKDEYLRMVAVLHANGIEVVEDIVLNHMNDAGSGNGQGGVDTSAISFYRTQSYATSEPDLTGGSKTFRYSCFATPAIDESATDYRARRGRFSKNWQNFFPNPSDNRRTGEDGSGTTFGTDIAYNNGSFGLASRAGFNPTQTSAYMRTGMRNWAIWDKKQTGCDGWRLDAVKHFPGFVAEDFLFNVQFNAGWASATGEMLAVGEWVGGNSELTAWVSAVQGRAGAFDFALRGFGNTPGVYGMVYGLGNYDMGNLPGAQQTNRDRSFSFVNSHDTFRPTLLPNGDYPTPANWAPGGELAPHIDPREPRLAAAYAVSLAVDGNPVVFIEDLFDVGTTGKRYTHLPGNATDLPLRADIANIIACHNVLGFKDGAYRVPHQAADYLIIERAGKAIIGVTDNWATWQVQVINTTFAPGTRLIDYGGSSANTDIRTVGADRRVQISTPPCNGTALRRGYSIWAPIGQTLSLNPAPRPTTQEWEMADDLGDSHPNSLGQGGALPANSRSLRFAGKFYPEAGKQITLRLFPEDTTQVITLLLLDKCRTITDSISGKGSLTKTFTAPATGWYQLAVRQGAESQPSQRCWVQATYTAPRSVDARATASFIPTTARLGADKALCQFSGRLTAFTAAGFTYQWRDSTGALVGANQSLVPPFAGLFSVIKTNIASGCSATDTVRVLRIVPLPQQPAIRQSGDTLVIDQEPGVIYQWSRNGTPIAGAVQNSYVAAGQTGGYSVRATNSTGCTINSGLFSYVTSVRKQIEAGITLLPNPTTGLVSIQFAGLAAKASSLALLLPDGGRMPLPAQLTQLDLSALPPGLYVLEITTSAGVGYKRLVRQ